MKFDILDDFTNTDLKTNIAMDNFRRMVLTGENIIPESEVEKYYLRMKSKGLENIHISLAPKFRGNEEDIARSQNQIADWLDNPINNLISSIDGAIFMKQDYINCAENRVDVSTGFPVKVEHSSDEKYKIRNYKKDIELFNQAINMIKELELKVAEYAI